MSDRASGGSRAGPVHRARRRCWKWRISQMSTEPSTGSDQLLSERVAAGILPRVLTSFDMVAIFVAIVLFITNAAVIQSAGPAAFGWWILAFLVYIFPDSIGTLDIRIQGIVITAFIVFSAVISILRFRVTQNIVNVVFV